ncbi:putative ABC transporter, permease protein [Megalodesulfovibrio gigas DSM 1382 = ATCC 19364]|uniref:Putative ABC transporter, permease protein n=1 Tax=Megalodesulfovibrio gigas (strain ATCC 19364 / DSM 1382 / NCIMB 9332 / VKM B-1759) TaxID=1121448 RepID=T2GAC1_MEGG1|nr:putative ABC transporter, permease protein [Megalodesulfovibrio gigas DSM 1382 = ATCC 19364]
MVGTRCGLTGRHRSKGQELNVAENTMQATASGRPPGGLSRGAVVRLLTLPGTLVSLVVLVTPLLVALYMSFTDWSPTRSSFFDASFVGFDNYSELTIYDTRFLYAVLRTLCIAAVCLGLEFVIGLGLAVLFLREFRGKSLLFSAFLSPMMILPVVVGYTFWMLFQSNGPINQIVELCFGPGSSPEWFRSAPLAVLAVVITEVWHWTPLFFLILLSGLNAVPENPVRAAVILGASPRQVFWRVVMPMLKPVIVVAFVIRTMEIIKLFDEVYMLTRGGPGSATETISLYIYKLAFNDFQLAYGAAAAFLVLLGCLLLIHLLLSPVRDQLLKGGR